jgi:hypothetical protein
MRNGVGDYFMMLHNKEFCDLCSMPPCTARTVKYSRSEEMYYIAFWLGKPERQTLEDNIKMDLIVIGWKDER